MSEKPDPKSAIQRYFNREISLKDAVAVLDAYIPSPEPPARTKEETSQPTPQATREAEEAEH